MKAIIDEFKLILQGKFIWIMLIAPLIISAAFGYVFKNNQLNEAPVAVVDLDHSTYSQQLIEKLDADQYINIKYVTYNYMEPNSFLYNEQYFGVIYLPAGLEKTHIQGGQTNIGLYVDTALSTATTYLRTGVTEVINTENASTAAGKLVAMGVNSAQAANFTTGLNLQTRLLYNPTNNTLMSSVIGFVNTVFLSILGGATLTIVPRLREQGVLAEALRRPLSLVLRVVPYALIATVSMYVVMGCLKQVGGLRFEANVFQLWIPFLMYTLSLSLLCMLVGWSASSPAKAAGRITMILLPSFILSGAQIPVALLPPILQNVSHVLPLSWHFKFLRGLGFRGGDLKYFGQELGDFLILITSFLVVIFLLMLNEMRKIRKAEREGKLHTDAMDTTTKVITAESSSTSPSASATTDASGTAKPNPS
ncbi:ABC transporter permease [Paenibacillus campi]|uniref:ABC transporter permease n=1 Tax=Paenibacillus campi TaxID=3106031 RepID=UPI002B00046D|nr:ABC transporter permease [Paenibacillus sp. SGZ-1009]